MICELTLCLTSTIPNKILLNIRCVNIRSKNNSLFKSLIRLLIPKQRLYIIISTIKIIKMAPMVLNKRGWKFFIVNICFESNKNE